MCMRASMCARVGVCVCAYVSMCVVCACVFIPLMLLGGITINTSFHVILF